MDEMIALNDEIAALVRAKVPLEGTLSQLGEDLPSRLGRITHMLAERMHRGESLSDILEREPQHFPPVYRAVWLAGLRAGRLPATSRGASVSALAPRRRQDRLVVRELGDELLVYDLDRHRACCLNASAALVWRHCDGHTPVTEIAKRLPGNWASHIS